MRFSIFIIIETNNDSVSFTWADSSILSFHLLANYKDLALLLILIKLKGNLVMQFNAM